jgi:hypothetical protein
MVITLTGHFFGVPFNLTASQEPIQWFNDPAWWQAIGIWAIGLATVTVAVFQYKLLDSQAKLTASNEEVAKEIRNYVLHVDPAKLEVKGGNVKLIHKDKDGNVIKES